MELQHTQLSLSYPPYSWDANAPFKAIYKGICFCGHTQYELAAERPLDSKFCHCKTCQRLHGAPFQWAAIVEKTDLRFTKGTEDLVFWKESERTLEHSLPCKVTCGRCRTPIMDEGRNMLLIFPTLIEFPNKEAEEKFQPTCHIFYRSRVVNITDGKPKWAGHKDFSEQIPET